MNTKTIVTGVIVVSLFVFVFIFSYSIGRNSKVCNSDVKSTIERSTLEALGEELFYIYNVSDGKGGLALFDDTSINTKSLDNLTILQVVYQNMPKYYVTENEDGSTMINKNDFLKLTKKLFGDITVDVQDFTIDNTKCTVSGSLITCISDLEQQTKTTSYVTYDGASLDGDLLVLNISFMSYEEKNGKIYFYKDKYHNNLISNTAYIESDLDNIDKLFKLYSKDSQKYVMKFKQDTTGNYYWVETEVK